jgi:hypothetical protein
MDIKIPGLRDRRIAAADENRTRNRREIYASGTPARRLSQRHPLGFDVRQAAFSRSLTQIDRVFLHQTEFFTDDPLPQQERDRDIADDHRLDVVIAHFVVRRDGTILYTHDIEFILNSISGRSGIDIEFEGHYNIRPDTTPSPSHPWPPRVSTAAIQSGRRLLEALNDLRSGAVNSAQHLSIQSIHPHGQFNRGKRNTCPGPDIWMNVGEWATGRFHWISDRVLPGYTNLGISEHQRNPAYDQSIR